MEIVLDRLRKTVTDERGHFTFGGVEPGIRGLCMPGKKYAAVNVPAGETTRAELSGFLPEVRVELYAEGRAYREPCRGVVVGLDSLFTLHEAKAEEGTRVYVVPEGAHELVDLLSCRVAPKAVPASGEVRFGPLDVGRYDIGVDGKGLLTTVEVSGPGATVRIQ